jgi:WXG100 family type VII secretion target
VGGYTVDPDQVWAADADLSAAAQSAWAAVGRVRAEAEELFTTCWHGPAATAFRLGWEQWADGAVAMVSALDDMARLLGHTGGGYAATEEAVRVALMRESG